MQRNYTTTVMLTFLLSITIFGCGTADETLSQRGAASAIGEVNPESTEIDESQAEETALPQAEPSSTSTPSETTVNTEIDSLCGMLIAPLFLDFPTAEALAWASHQVIIGTVTEKLPSQWGDPVAPGAGITARNIYTDYAIDVKERLRGVNENPIHLRVLGGQIDSCVMKDTSNPSIEVGQQVFLFLGEPVSGTKVLTYPLVNGPDGFWQFTTDEIVRAPIDQFAELGGTVSVDVVKGQILASLVSGQQPEGILPKDTVSTDEAPVWEVSTGD